MPAVRAAGLRERGFAYVDAAGRIGARMPADAFGGEGIVAEIEILRGDLGAILHGATRVDVEYLFDDSIALRPPIRGRVMFDQFVGVGARRFIDVFSMALSSGTVVRRKGSGGIAVEWSSEKANVRVPMMPNSYLNREQVAEDELHDLTITPEGST